MSRRQKTISEPIERRKKMNANNENNKMLMNIQWITLQNSISFSCLYTNKHKQYIHTDKRRRRSNNSSSKKERRFFSYAFGVSSSIFVIHVFIAFWHCACVHVNWICSRLEFSMLICFCFGRFILCSVHTHKPTQLSKRIWFSSQCVWNRRGEAYTVQ